MWTMCEAGPSMHIRGEQEEERSAERLCQGTGDSARCVL